ncbi:unnamed protein product, partial [Amoebophrya sp. A25]
AVSLVAPSPTKAIDCNYPAACCGECRRDECGSQSCIVDLPLVQKYLLAVREKHDVKV